MKCHPTVKVTEIRLFSLVAVRSRIRYARSMKFSIFFLLTLAIAGSSVWAQDSTNKETNLPPDPFSELGDEPEIPDYALEVDRSRGSFSGNEC